MALKRRPKSDVDLERASRIAAGEIRPVVAVFTENGKKTTGLGTGPGVATSRITKNVRAKSLPTGPGKFTAGPVDPLEALKLSAKRSGVDKASSTVAARNERARQTTAPSTRFQSAVLGKRLKPSAVSAKQSATTRISQQIAEETATSRTGFETKFKERIKKEATSGIDFSAEIAKKEADIAKIQSEVDKRGIGRVSEETARNLSFFKEDLERLKQGLPSLVTGNERSGSSRSGFAITRTDPLAGDFETSAEFAEFQAEEKKRGEGSEARIAETALGLAVSGGAEDAPTQEEKIGAFLRLPEGQSIVFQDGKLRIVSDDLDFEPDPFVRAEERANREKAKQVKELALQATRAEEQLTREGTLLGGGQAGQTNKSVAEIRRKRINAEKDIEDKFGDLKEDLFFEEQSRQTEVLGKIEQKRIDDADPAKLLRKKEAAELLERIDELTKKTNPVTGENYTIGAAKAIIQDEDKVRSGIDYDFSEADEAFGEMLQNDVLDPKNFYSKAIELTGGRIADARKLAETYGVMTDSEIQKAEDEHLRTNFNYSEDQINERHEARSDEEQATRLYNGELEIVSVGQFLDKLEGQSPESALRKIDIALRNGNNDAGTELLLKARKATIELKTKKEEKPDVRGAVDKGFVQVTTDPQGNVQIKTLTEARKTDTFKDDLDLELDLKKNFDADKRVKDFRDIDTKFSILLNALKQAKIEENLKDLEGKPAGSFIAIDQALITVFNKITDPSSVVRESEYARSKADQSFLDSWRGGFQKEVNTGGAGLTNNNRRAIVRMARRFRNASSDNFEQIQSQFETKARKGGLDVEFVTGKTAVSEEGVVDITQLNQAFESGGDPGAVGTESTGAKSFGTFQILDANIPNFVNRSKFKNEFEGLTPDSQEFEDKWKSIAKDNPEEFKEEQEDFIFDTHFAPQINLIGETGWDVKAFSPNFRSLIWDTAVQHGPNNDIITGVLLALPDGASEEDAIIAILDERGTRFPSSPPEVQEAVKKRFSKTKKILTGNQDG